MMDVRKIFGDRGEVLAAAYLQKKGLQVLHKQYRTPFGEIDLVCQDGNEVIFVEVKSRKTHTFGYPEESITQEKLRHMVASAEFILEQKHWSVRPWRIDVIAIEFDQTPPHVEHFSAIDIPDGF